MPTAPGSGGLIIGGLAVIYFLPVIVGAIRNIEHLTIILLLVDQARPAPSADGFPPQQGR